MLDEQSLNSSVSRRTVTFLLPYFDDEKKQLLIEGYVSGVFNLIGEDYKIEYIINESDPSMTKILVDQLLINDNEKMDYLETSFRFILF
jgi:hypothetical protein